MPPLQVLPPHLEQWLEHWEHRSGITAAIRDAIEFKRWSDTEVANRVAPQLGAVGGVERGTFRNKLNHFLGKKGYSGAPLDSFELEAVLAALDLGVDVPQSGRSNARIDYWRNTWRDKTTTKWPYDKDIEAQPLQPTAHKRVLDALELTWSKATDPAGHLIDPHAVALLGLSNELRIDFFATESVKVDAGDLLMFDGAHPHRLVVAEPAKAVLVRADPGRTCHLGILQYPLTPQRFDGFKKHGVLHWTVALRTSFALHRIAFSLDDNLPSPLRGIMDDFKSGVAVPQAHQIRQLGRFLRLSEEHFYRLICPADWTGFPCCPLPKIAFRPFRLIKASTLQEAFSRKSPVLSRRGKAHAAAFSDKHWTDRALISSRAGSAIHNWANLGRHARGPTISAFAVHDNLQRDALDDHHSDDPGEAFHFVVNNSKPVIVCQDREEFQRKSKLGITSGAFAQNDSLWFTTELAHTFGLDGSTRSEMIHVRWHWLPEG